MDLPKRKMESSYIYQTLCNSQALYVKSVYLEFCGFMECFDNTVAMLLSNDCSIVTGSRGEGTEINSQDYSKIPPCYVSDRDSMQVLCYVQVIDVLPRRLSICNHMFCLAERGEHTTDGFRKLRIIYSPERNSLRQYKENLSATFINMSVEHGYISSSKFLDTTVNHMGYLPYNDNPIKTDLGTHGPSKMLEIGGSAADYVPCFHVKTWPKEAESWFTRQTHWPDRKLKSKIKKIGYLLVATGNSNSQESDLEWRCSFSIAEKMLFQSLTTFQRCTFLMLKVLLKEYLPSDINTDGEKEFLSTYHMKTLFLWCLEDSMLKWVPENMLDIIGYIFDKLLRWINKQSCPHYFIPSVNLFDGRGLDGRKKSLICLISDIRKDLSNKIKHSQFLMSQEISQELGSMLTLGDLDRWVFCRRIYYYVMESFIGRMQTTMNGNILEKKYALNQLNFSFLMLIEGLISLKPHIDPQVHYLYRALYTDPIHDKLLTVVVPGLIDQYRGCIYLAKYCMAARDSRLLPDVLHTAESLLKHTLHLDSCSGHVKLACLYIATGDFVHALDILDRGESNFLYRHKNMETSAFRASQWKGVDVSTVMKEVCTFIFQKWAEGQVTSDIVVTWPEYITVPDLLQFELIHKSTKKVIDISFKHKGGSDKMVGIDFHLQWPPLSMIKLFKFVCADNLGRSSTSHMENLVTDLITSSLRVFLNIGVNDIYTIFNMAAWCYVKIKKYKQAARMMTVAIGSSSQTDTMKRCAFGHHFLAYIIEQCLAKGSRVLVDKREH